MRVHLVNPSDNSFGTAVITPRWLFVLAAATPAAVGDPILVDESLEQIVPESIQPGDIVGISVHTGNALRGYAVGRMARARGAWVVYGGIHATLFPEEALERGQAHAVVKGDGDLAWAKVVTDCLAGNARKNLRRRPHRRQRIPLRALGPDGSREIYVGLGANHSRLPQALLLLQRLAHRRTEAAPAQIPKRRRRNHRAAPPRFSLHRPGRRQLLSRHVYRSAPRARAGQHRQARRAHRHSQRAPVS